MCYPLVQYAVMEIMYIASTKNGVMVHVVTVRVKQVVGQYVRSNNAQNVMNPFKYQDIVAQFAKVLFFNF